MGPTIFDEAQNFTLTPTASLVQRILKGTRIYDWSIAGPPEVSAFINAHEYGAYHAGVSKLTITGITDDGTTVSIENVDRIIRGTNNQEYVVVMTKSRENFFLFDDDKIA